MRTMLLTSAMLIGLASPSFAQTQGQGPGQAGQFGSAQQQAQQEGLTSGLGQGPMAQLLRNPGAFANGSFFRVRHGDDEIDLHCPPRLQIGTCVTGATQLMHNLQNIQTGSEQQSNQ